MFSRSPSSPEAPGIQDQIVAPQGCWVELSETPGRKAQLMPGALWWVSAMLVDTSAHGSFALFDQECGMFGK